ncbi:unnamed protein product [Caenorhabditis brenneri]
MAKRSATTPRSEIPTVVFSNWKQPDIEKQFEELPEGTTLAIAPHTASFCNGVYVAVNQMCKVEGKPNKQKQHKIEFTDNDTPDELDDLIGEVFKRLGSTKFYDLKISGIQQCDSTVAFIPLMMCLYLTASHNQDTVVSRSSMNSIADEVLQQFSIKIASPLAMVQAMNQGSREKVFVVPQSGSYDVASHNMTSLFDENEMIFLKTNLHPSTIEEPIHPNRSKLRNLGNRYHQQGIVETIEYYSKNNRHRLRWTDLQKECHSALMQCVKRGCPITGFESVKGGVLLFVPANPVRLSISNYAELLGNIAVQVANSCKEKVGEVSFNFLERAGPARLVNNRNVNQDLEGPMRTYNIQWKPVVPKKKGKANSK